MCVCVCVDNCVACLFEMPLVQGLTSTNMGNRDRQVQQLFQAGTVAQDYVVLIIMENWDPFQVYCAVFQSVSIFFILKILQHSKRTRLYSIFTANIYIYIKCTYRASQMCQTSNNSSL